MERYTRLNQLVRKSFKHLNRVQTGSAFVRHYFLVVEHADELRRVREMQLTYKRGQTREEYCPI